MCVLWSRKLQRHGHRTHGTPHTTPTNSITALVIEKSSEADISLICWFTDYWYPSIVLRLYLSLSMCIQFIYDSVLKMSCNSVKCGVWMLISSKYCDESAQTALYIGNIDFWCGPGPLYPHCWMSRCLASSAAPLTSLRGPVTEPRPLYLQICHRPVLRPDVLQHYISDYILHL